MDLASLGIRVDTAQVEKGSSDLDKLTASADRAEKSASALQPAFTGVGKGLQEAARAGGGLVNPINASSAGIKVATLSAKQYSQALRLLPAQITDIVTGLASGQSPFIVAIQQGGQLRDSFGGFGNTLRALASVITPARIAIGATAGTAALLVKGFIDGQREGLEFAKAIALSGNASGTTRDELADMAASIDDVVGTQASAAATLARLARGGKVAAENLQDFATVAQQMSRLSGQPIEEIAAAFEDLARRPVEASLKLNESMHFLTVEIYQQIKALQEQGRVFEAGEAAQRAYRNAQASRSQEIEAQLSLWQRMARGTADVFGDMWDAIANVGRPQTISTQIAQIERQIREVAAGVVRFEDDNGTGGFAGDRAQRIRQLEQELKSLRAVQAANEAAARADAQRAKSLDAYIAADKERLKVTQARREVIEDIAKAQLNVDVAAIQRSLTASLSGYSAYEAQLEALYDADLVNAREYYDAKAELIDRDAKLRTAALQGEAGKVREELRRLEAARDAAGREAFDKTKSEAGRIEAERPFSQDILTSRERLRDIEAELAAILGESASKRAALAIEETRAAHAAERAIKDARAAAEDYFAVISQQRQRELSAFGLGDRQREFNAGVSEIEDRFAQEQRRLNDQKSRGDFKDREDHYEKLLGIAREYRDKDLADFQEYWQQFTEKQSSFFVGAQEAMANYIDSARDIAGQTEELFTNAFQSMEDALVGFVQTGKLDFKSLAESIIADLIRIQLRAALVQAIGGAGGILGALFGGATGGTGAGGGTPVATGVNGGVLYADVGIQRVPRDNQVAILHKDEAVLTAAMNPFAGGKGLGGGTSFSFGPTYITGDNMNIAQIDSLVRQRNAESENRIAENLKRGRWDGVLA